MKIFNIKRTALLVLSLFLCGCSFELPDGLYRQSEENITEYEKTEITSKDNLEVHFVDVGQADGMLINFPDGQFAVIDSGDTQHSDDFVKYLEEQNVEKIAFAVATHGHEDHIGGMKKVLENFDVGAVLRPDADYDSTIYTSMLYAIEENGAEEIFVKAGDSFECGGALFEVLGPVSEDYEDYNDFSVVMKMTYGDVSFLFTGDAQEEAERDILSVGYDVESTVLKVGHHGSSTSSCKDFTSFVKPEISVISAGKNNDYGHPHKEVLEVLEKQGCDVYRTDINGDIVVLTDGKNIEVSVSEKTEENEVFAYEETEEIYIGNIKSKAYHSEECGSLPAEKNRIYLTKEEAVSGGYRAHESCVGEDR